MEGNNTNPTNVSEEVKKEEVKEASKDASPVSTTIETKEETKKAEIKEEEVVDPNAARVVKTDIDSKDGQNKCPKCGATEISLNVKNGRLRCEYCRYEFDPVKVKGLETDISKLSGKVHGSGATNIIADVNQVVTFKCSSCGAEVVVDTSEKNQAKCHWCRNMLSVNQQIPNGAFPDVVLPFMLKKEDARGLIEQFVGKRKFFAHPQFKKEFTTQNIMGVYFPYMLIDVNAHASLSGEGEHQVRSYQVKSGDHYETYYDADLYRVKREYDITIEGLSIESSADKLNNNSKEKTNNIINSIMPFDVENCVKYDANYLKGYTSEKRDVNIEQLETVVDIQSKDVSRHAANETLKFYDRGVKWNTETLDVKGQQWKSAYLPVWLYSYQEVTGNKKLLHYVAVNARTKETMGSVPIHMPKLVGVSVIVEILGIICMFLFYAKYNDADWFPLLFLLAGPIYYGVIYSKYRNQGARHTYEKETKTNLTNMVKVDDFIEHRKRLRNSTMTGANNKRVYGSTATNKAFETTNKIAGAAVSSLPGGNFIKDRLEKQGEVKPTEEQKEQQEQK